MRVAWATVTMLAVVGGDHFFCSRGSRRDKPKRMVRVAVCVPRSGHASPGGHERTIERAVPVVSTRRFRSRRTFSVHEHRRNCEQIDLNNSFSNKQINYFNNPLLRGLQKGKRLGTKQEEKLDGGTGRVARMLPGTGGVIAPFE